MAKLTPGITFTGPLGDYSAYYMRGVDRIVLRRKGGPSRQQILNGKTFRPVRLNLQEFSGCAMATRLLRRILKRYTHLSDYNFTGKLNALFKQVQVLDTANPRGTRSIELSKHAHLLQNFSLNKDYPFTSSVREPMMFNRSRTGGSVRITIPALTPGIGLVPGTTHPYCQLQFTLGVLPDLFFNNKLKRYAPLSDEYSGISCVNESTSWQSVQEHRQRETVELSLDAMPPNEHFTLVLAAAIQYGTASGKRIEEAPRAGCAMILALR